MPRLFLFPFCILGSPLAHPGFHAPAVARKFCAVFRASKKHKTIRPETKHPLSSPVFTSGKNRPCVAREKGHSEPWTPGSTAPQHKAAQGRSGVEAGQPQGSERRYPKRPQKSIQWSHGQGPARPSPSRVCIVLCSLLYTFSRAKAHPATTLGAPLCWREGLPHPRPRRRYYPARRKVRGEEGPKVFRLKTKKILAFRYANPIQTPHRR